MLAVNTMRKSMRSIKKQILLLKLRIKDIRRGEKNVRASNFLRRIWRRNIRNKIGRGIYQKFKK